MNCTECQENIVAYLEDVLPASEKEQVAAHLQSCPTCGNEAAEHARLRDRLLADGKTRNHVLLDTCVMDRISQQQTLKLRRRRMRRRYGLIGLGVAAAAVFAAVFLWPGGRGVAWADVIRQIRTARTAHLKLTTREFADGKEIVTEAYIKSPDKARQQVPAALMGKETIIIVNGKRQIILSPSEKRCVSAETVLPGDFAEQFLTKYLLPAEDHGSPPAQSQPAARLDLFSDSGGRLTPFGIHQRNGRRLARYRVESTANPAGPQDATYPQTYYWFDPKTNDLALITLERAVNSATVETTSVEVRLNINLPDELFSTDVPPGYTTAAETAGPSDGVSLKTPGKLRELYTKYEQARAGIRSYRLIIWRGGGLDWRIVCDGNRVRMEEFRNNSRVRSDPDFDTVWKRANAAPERTWLTYGDRIARIDRSPRGTEVKWDRGGLSWDTRRLSDLGWPTWPDYPYKYQWLPSRPDRPGLIGVRAVSNFVGSEWEGRQYLLVYWIDPAKDYLCVRKERYCRKGQPWKDDLEWRPTEPEVVVDRPEQTRIIEYDNVSEITESAQTSEGRWYPKAIQDRDHHIVDGKRYIIRAGGVQHYRLQLDTTGPIADDLFAWPADVPKPQ